ncbi:MAG TPA: adenylate/guanylate cyclase domain-containing protein [Actinomycetota bacterium]|nr:adenylate/guanylate cyclase domain-containing protein [Actinomycetota bacterium]
MRRLDRVGGTATILVTDLVGSTAMFDRLGDDVAERLLRDHLGELRELVRSFGGVEVKSTGDGIMAAFPAAWLATECAVAMQRSLHLRNERAEGSGEPLHVRIGLHSGDTTADRHDYYGIAVAAAARLCDKAPPDGILVSGVTRGLVGSRGGHRFTDAGIPALKGIDEPFQAWALEWGPGQLPPATPPGLERRRGPLIAAGAGALLVVGLGAGMLVAGGDESRREPPVAPGSIVRVSVKGGYPNASQNGGEATSHSFAPSISGDGRSVVFVSTAEDLVPDGADGERSDVFHVQIGPGPSVGDATLQIVSSDAALPPGDNVQPSVSDLGDVVGFVSNAADEAANGPRSITQTVYVHELEDGETTLASVNNARRRANGNSFDVALSGNGGFVAFTSAADNLSVRPDRNGAADVFVRDLVAGKTNRVNIRSGTHREADDDSADPALSEDGRFVAFESIAASLVASDTNNSSDVFRFDRDPDEFKTVLASVTSDGRLTEADNYDPAISDDGTRIVFVSRAPDLAEGDDEGADVFVHDFATGETRLVSAAIRGEVAGAGRSARPAISGDGRFVVFDSASGDLVPGDDNGTRDVFLYELETERVTRLSLTDEDDEATKGSFAASISDDGRYVVFTSSAGLVADDVNRRTDVYLRGPLY